jgi:N-acyl-D-aspartate/D-glutamate deacylase
MEGVEDIPGTALAEGISWGWESFTDYMNVLEGQRRAIDVGTQVPHGALRAYVMGPERCHDAIPTEAEIEQMVSLTREALQAGALGFTSSRTHVHRGKDGKTVPGTVAGTAEMVRISQAIGEVGHGVVEVIDDYLDDATELRWIEEFAANTGKAILISQNPVAAGQKFEAYSKLVRSGWGAGLKIRPQMPGRAQGMLFCLSSSIHPFSYHPTWTKDLKPLKLAQRVAAMKRPEVRARLLAEEPKIDGILHHVVTEFDKFFRVGETVDYEPPQEECIAAIAQREGRSAYEVIYDMMLELDGKRVIYYPSGPYPDYSLDRYRGLLNYGPMLLTLSDAGAHCGVICDASMPTFMLSFWTRDRTRGEKLPLEMVVQKLTEDCAHTYELFDRGTLEPGRIADLNVIDYDNLRLGMPEVVYDLPKDGMRFIQKAEGYVATVKSGEVIFENGEATGALPGALIRGPQNRGKG